MEALDELEALRKLVKDYTCTVEYGFPNSGQSKQLFIQKAVIHTKQLKEKMQNCIPLSQVFYC